MRTDTSIGSDCDPLLPAASNKKQNYGAHDEERPQQPLLSRNWSLTNVPSNPMEDNELLVGVNQSICMDNDFNDPTSEGRMKSIQSSILAGKKKLPKKCYGVSLTKLVCNKRVLYCIVYALVNLIISAPGLYGYAAVIFNHPVFVNDMNALSKLVLFSSLIHQLGFCLFSSLDFAIGTVQDAGLIFLSSMANTIANEMLNDGHSPREILSTTLVLLSLGTAVLGMCLILIGRAKLADAVSYLPMPVVGGYLAFIGYFCCQAGTALCISTPLITFGDWKHVVLDSHNFLLAIPGLTAGLFLTVMSRKSTNDVVLPFVMILIPALFYVVVYASGVGLEGAREAGWVGQLAPSVPVQDLFVLVRFSEVRWDLWIRIFPTWLGMVFVVSFASCLDIAAISMDMGEALDTNHELATVGICNLMSGVTFGFTGSYIFSQTIFTYRTGIHSKWIGVLVMIGFLYIVCSPINMLQIAPLFFLGSTLIFIGYDLCYEWLWEIRHQMFLYEYGIVWLTFILIQIVGIDAGILLGVLLAIFQQVVMTAQTSSIQPINKRSRAVWTPEDSKYLHNYAYHPMEPKILTLEMNGTVFFGSSLSLLNQILEHCGIENNPGGDNNRSNNNIDNNKSGDDGSSGINKDVWYRRSPHTPHTSSFILNNLKRSSSILPSATTSSPYLLQVLKKRKQQQQQQQSKITRRTHPPKFLVLDLRQIANLDASATRACFLQLAKICSKRGVIVCASGATPRIEWMLRSHDVSYKTDEEEEPIKARLQSDISCCSSRSSNPAEELSLCERILLFVTIQEALEFSENILIHRLRLQKQKGLLHHQHQDISFTDDLISRPQEDASLSSIMAHILGFSNNDDEKEILDRLNSYRYHEEIEYDSSGKLIFQKETHADSFYVVLKGAVANYTGSSRISIRMKQPVVSGAGLVRVFSKSNLLDVNDDCNDTTQTKEKKKKSIITDKDYHDNKKNTVSSSGNVVATLWPVGGIFGYTDVLLQRPRCFRAIAVKDGTKVAKITNSHMALMQTEDPTLQALIYRVLLHASTQDLANCSCDDV